MDASDIEDEPSPAASRLTQTDIDQLIACPKRITSMKTRWPTPKGAYRRGTYHLVSDGGDHTFQLFIRQNEDFRENFSVGLDYRPRSGGRIPLIRYNGPHGPHENFPHHAKPHIHKASEEDINAGRMPLKNAMATTIFGPDVTDALCRFVRECRIGNHDRYFPNLDQLSLPFEGLEE